MYKNVISPFSITTGLSIKVMSITGIINSRVTSGKSETCQDTDMWVLKSKAETIQTTAYLCW